MAEFLCLVNSLRHRTDYRSPGPLDPVVYEERDPEGHARLLFSTRSGSVVRITLHLESSVAPAIDLMPDDIVRVELLVATAGARTRIPARGDGPFPYTRWLTGEEYVMVSEFYSELLAGNRYEAVTMSCDVEWPGWIILEIPRPGRPEQRIVIALPLASSSWGEARESGFLFLVSATAPGTRRTRVRLHPHVHLCDPVRRHIVVARAQ